MSKALAVLLLLCGSMFAQHTYYVSQSVAGGSDANTSTQAQSKTTPWKNLPGSRTSAPTYTPVAGDTFILMGCDVWPNATFPINWTWSGTGGSPITVDRDVTWFNTINCPTTWNRAKFDAGSAVINPPECTGTNAFWTFGNVSNVTVNWIELVHYFWASPNSDGSCAGHTFWVTVNSSASNVNWVNTYVHAWTHDAASHDLNGNAFSNGCPTCLVDYAVIDNSDGSRYSGGGQQWPTQHSIITYATNAIKPHMSGEYAYNNISHMGTGPGGNHPNCIETIGGIQGNGTFYIHDNWIHDMPNSPTEQCETLQVGNTNETDYVWNNVWCCHIGGGDVAQFPQNNQPNVVGLYFFNNVWEEDSGNGVCANASNATSWTSAFVMVNNFCLTPNAPNGTVQSQHMMSGSTITSPTTLVFSNNINETIAVAASHGCIPGSTFPYMPSGSCSDTKGTGSNLTSTFWPGGFSTNDTTFACSEQTIAGVVQSVCPQRTSNARPGSGAWDSGAYEFLSNQTLTVTMAGNTTGSTVTSSPAGINCPTTCSASFVTGTNVTLTESTPLIFAGWTGGGCSGIANTCGVTVNATTNVTATFYPNSNDIYCPLNGVPLWGATDGPALLPFACYHTGIASTPAPGAVINVAANSATDLQTKLTAAVCGQQITLPAGSVYSGHFTVPSLSCAANNYLWIVTSGLASLPPEGARYSTTYNSNTVYLPQFGPCYSGVASLAGRPAFTCPVTPGTYTAQLITPDAAPPLTFSNTTSGVRVIGLEITRTAGTHITFALVSTNAGSVDHIIFDRCWLHGIEQNGSGGGDETDNGINTSAVSYLAAIDSYFNNFYCVSVSGTCSDSHAMDGGLNGVNSTVESVTKIVNNFMEAAGETIIFGGGGSNTVPNDFEIRLDFFFKPLQWNPADPAYNGGVIIGANPAKPLIVKNLFELKNNNRILVEGFQAFNNWAGFSQGGEAFAIGAKNQTGNLCPICAVSNVTVRYGQVNTVAGAFDIAFGPADDGGFAAGTFNVSHHDLVADNLAYATCNQCAATLTEETFITTGTAAPVQLHDVNLSHVTAVLASSTSFTPSGMIGLSGPNASTALEMYNIAFTNNLMLTAQFGTFNHADGCPSTNCACSQTAGLNTINACWQGPSGSGTYSFTGNCIIGTPVRTWPTGNVTSIATYAAALTNYNNGNGGDYTVAPGACKAIATDGSDPGANLGKIKQILSGASAQLFIPPIWTPSNVFLGANELEPTSTGARK